VVFAYQGLQRGQCRPWHLQLHGEGAAGGVSVGWERRGLGFQQRGLVAGCGAGGGEVLRWPPCAPGRPGSDGGAGGGAEHDGGARQRDE